MIELIVLTVLILFAIYLIITFLSYTSLFINLILLIALLFLITKDLKDRDNHKYYIYSLLLTAIFFILSSTGIVKAFLVLTEKIFLPPAVVSVIVAYIFATLIAFIYEYSNHLKQKLKR